MNERLRVPESLPDEAAVGEIDYDALSVGEVVGRGGNAVVREATLPGDPGQVVALKEPHAAGAVPEVVVERFRREAATWTDLDDHPHVVTVHDWGTEPHPWLALEFMDAGSLAERAGDVDLAEGLWTGARVASALAHAHRAGVAHLDLTPDNVLLGAASGDGWAVPGVADWGLARALRPEAANLEGLSPRYAAPEQFAPDRFGAPGAATDVYGLGVVLYELLVGAPPFDGPPRALRDAVVGEAPPPASGRNPQLPAAVDDVLDRALAKEPGDRHGSMAALRRDIEALLAERTEYELETSEQQAADGASAGGDGGGTTADTAPSTPSAAANPYDRALALAGEGFVRLTEGYFARREPAPPLEAWRRGVTLSDARAGRAVERTVPDEDGGERVRLGERLLDGLAAGTDQVVLGPPGSGKSTVCKRVACEWFDRGRGPVFYRESGRGERFEAPDALARQVSDAEGHALVVVEDAVRPEANAVFELLDRVRDVDDVTLLLDARESEWREADPGADPFGTDPVARGREALDPEYVPRPDREEHERFVRAVEAAVDRSLDVDVEALRDDVRRAAAVESEEEEAQETRPGELFYLLHRLTALARDPLADDAGETTLTAAVAEVHDRLADAGGDALDVGICANALNAAGVGVHPELLYAVVADDPLAVDDAVEVMDGRVLFPRTADWSGGTRAYPAIHEAWSTEFLAHLIAAGDEDAARERFGRMLSGILSLADDPDRRERVAGALGGDAPYLAHVRDDPAAWADEMVGRLFGLAEAYPRLARLFGTAETAAYDLPEACSAERRRSVPLLRGHSYRGASDYERARSEYERALERARSADDRRRVVAARNGLGTVARLQNDHGTAHEQYERSLDVARDLGDPRLEAEVLGLLGMNATRRDDYDEGREYVARSVELSRDRSDRLGVARCLQTLGTIEYRQGNPELAREQLRESLEIKRELGDRQGIARSLNRIAGAFMLEGDDEHSREYLQRSLDIWRELGNRWWIAALLHNLGVLARDQGDYERARECHRNALEINRELAVPHGLVMNLNKLGRVAEHRGEYERAREYHRRSLERSRELDKPHDIARALQDLGSTVRELGELATAREHLERSLELYRDVGDTFGEGESLRKLGTVAHRQGTHGEARERYEAARDCFAEVGNESEELGVLESLVELSRDAGHPDRARDYCETARRRLDETDPPDDVRDAIESLCGAVERDGES